MDEEIKKLKEIIEAGEYIVFFGGAGVSTESGIPDFRSEEGLYKARQEFGRSPEEILSHSFFVSNPNIFYKYYKKNLIYQNVLPNAAHNALARLETSGKLKAVVTQNIDGLHQMAGSKTVYELHGSVLRNYCMDCHEKYELGFILDENNCRDMVPICKKCGGTVRPDVVLYEEALDGSVIHGAAEHISKADTLIIGGTSLVVYPAAGLIQYFSGKNLILINKSETSKDGHADLIVRRPIGEVLDAL